MSGPLFTNPTEAYGYSQATDGNLGYILTGSFKATAPIARGQIVELDSALGVNPADNDSDIVIGVATHDAAAGKVVEVCVLGPCLVQSGGGDTITAGSLISSGANGVAAAAGTDAGDKYVGWLMAAEGDVAGALKPMYVNVGIVDTDAS